MSATHTPGPWRVQTVNKKRSVTITSLVCGIATVNANLDREANAHLIAAAPELLRVLKAALQQSGCDGDLCMHQWHEDARKVIDEAEGRA